jgi:hypothetical protein
VRRQFGLDDDVTFELFEVIFDYHFGVGEIQTPAGKRAKFWNFISFMLQLDNEKLRQYLHMTRSRASFFEDGRKAFGKGVLEGDTLAMDMALWRSDPIRPSVIDLCHQQRHKFQTIFECDDPSDAIVMATSGVALASEVDPEV